jgi:phosphopantothenate-cysteine ligase
MERESADAPRVLVTSGGTTCPIDDVRVVTNIGTGLFGSQIAESLLRSGCRVHYLHSRGARRPFFRCGEVDFDADLESELARVRRAHEQYERCRDRLTPVEAPTFDDYAREARRIVSELPIEIAVMTIAASDYAPVRAGGKLSSDAARFTLEMARCPKIIEELRALRPELFVVGFKLSSGIEHGEMVERTRAWMRRGEYPLAVANDLTARRLPEREVCLLGPGDQVRGFAGMDVATPLVEAILAAYRGRR